MKALLFALLASPAFAGDTMICGSSVALLTPSRNAVAEVRITNEYAQGPTWCEDVISLNGTTVRVTFYNGDGEEPDTIEVSTELGFYAVPDSLTLEEYESGVIEIFADGGLTS